jgi:hypothetical protein
MEEARERIARYLQQHTTLTLAAWEEEGPWAAALFYASDGLELYFLSDPKTRHGRDLAANPRVAITIQDDHQEWSKIKGLQMEAAVRPVEGEEEMARAVAVYVEKYPFVAGYLRVMMSPFVGIARFLDRFMERLPFVPHIPAGPARFYRVIPRRIWLTDNELRFGHRDEVTL